MDVIERNPQFQPHLGGLKLERRRRRVPDHPRSRRTYERLKHREVTDEARKAMFQTHLRAVEATATRSDTISTTCFRRTYKRLKPLGGHVQLTPDFVPDAPTRG
jgi:hypothetical protein